MSLRLPRPRCGSLASSGLVLALLRIQMMDSSFCCRDCPKRRNCFLCWSPEVLLANVPIGDQILDVDSVDETLQ